ncbi:MAG: hypothetical protein KKB70_06555 [Proteobacteria bacterium]|nr:hypothetical protein [Pseudomonadota bacterium]MBU1612020.1 hypothetical protein [Pseudomonadota bacterium]
MKMNDFKQMYAIVLFMLALASGGCSAGPDSLAELLPAQMEGWRLDQVITGTDAMNAVNRLHASTIQMEDAAIGHYSGRSGPMTVWISRATGAAAGREQAILMLEKMMRTPDTPFSNSSHVQEGGVDVYRVEGLGQAHLIFARNALVYWISLDPAFEPVALEAFLRAD